MPLSLPCYLFTFLFFYTPLILLSALFSYLLVIPRSVFLFYHFILLFTSSSASSAKGTDCTDVLGLFFQKILVTGIFMHISFMHTCGLFLSLTPFFFYSYKTSISSLTNPQTQDADRNLKTFPVISLMFEGRQKEAHR